MYLPNQGIISLIRPACSIVAVILFILPTSAASDLSKSSCESATYIEPTTTFRSLGRNLEPTHCFETQVGEIGILSIDVSAAAFDRPQPRLGSFGQTCGKQPFEEVDFTIFERSIDSIVVEIRSPGSYLFCISAEDALLPLGEIVVRTVFVEDPLDKVGDPNEEEPDPDLSTSNCPHVGDPNEEEPDPDLLTGLPIEVLEDLCLKGEFDDHGNTRACATHLGWFRDMAGILRNNWGDDHDEFVFVVSKLRTVSIETTGDTDTVGTLFDRHGRRLQIDDDGGAGDNFRIVRALAPGFYYLRVEGRHHSEGPYGLSLKSRGR